MKNYASDIPNFKKSKKKSKKKMFWLAEASFQIAFHKQRSDFLALLDFF